MQSDWKKYKEYFVFSILEEIPDDLKYEVEQKYLDSLVGIENQIYNKNRYSQNCDEYFVPKKKPCIICKRIFDSTGFGDNHCSEECHQRSMEKARIAKNCEEWRYSNYEYKNIHDWNVEDFMAADWDDRWSK